MNEKYSYKDFTRKAFLEVTPKEFNDSEIVGSCFHQGKPNTKIFPDGLEGVTFIKCNLDNVLVPEECEIIGGCHRLIKEQNDLEDWIVDETLRPIEPVDKAVFAKLGLSVLPADIPGTKLDISKVRTKTQEKQDILAAQINALIATSDAGG